MKNFLHATLFALGLLFGGAMTLTTANADSTIITTMSFNDANSPVFTSGTNSTLDYTHARPIGDKKGNFLNVWGANNSCGAVTTTITETDMTTYGQWTLEFDWACFGGCNNRAGNTSVLDATGNAIITFTDAANWNNTVTVSDGNTLNIYPCEKTNRISANTGNQLTAKYWYHITLVGSANGIKFTAAPYNEDGVLQEATIVKSQLSTTNASPKTLSLAPGSCGSVAVDSLSLTASNDVTASYNYVVKYVCDGASVKDNVTRNDVEGTAISIPAGDKASFFDAEGTTKYIYVSDDSEGKKVTADGNTVVTVTFRKADTFTYTITGNTAAFTVKEGKAFEGESVKVDYPAYQLVNGTLYSAKKLSDDGKGYYFYLTMTENGMTKDIDYSTSVADNVVYYKEAEDIEGLTACSNSNTAIRSSNGASAYAASSPVAITTLAAGKYKLTSVACDAAGKTANAVFSYTNGTDTLFTQTCANINWDSQTSEEINLAGETTIYLAVSGRASQGIDLIYIQKTGDADADPSTAISTVAAKAADADAIYSISGVRTSKPAHGLYISGGKKYVK